MSAFPVEAPTGPKPDILIVFGARVRRRGIPSPLLQRRLEGAVTASGGCENPVFLVMGGEGAAGPAEADVMGRFLKGQGIAADRIVRERKSRDTLEQVRLAAGIIASIGGAKRILLCTSSFHQPRCALLLRMLGLSTEQPAMPDDRSFLGTRLWLYYAVRELAATAWDVLLLAGLLSLGRGYLDDDQVIVRGER